MPGIILGLSSIQMRPIDEPMLVVWNDLGLRYGVALRVPSVRRDIIKLSLIQVTDGSSRELKLHVDEATRELTDGKFNYEVREPGNDSEIESCLRVIIRNKQYESQQ